MKEYLLLAAFHSTIYLIMRNDGAVVFCQTVILCFISQDLMFRICDVPFELSDCKSD